MSSRRRRRRESPRERRKARAAKISEMTQPVHNIPVYEILNEGGVELIHEKSMELLKEVGIDFYLDDAKQILEEHGVEMKGDTAFFEPGLIEEYVSKAPDHFIQLARNPDNNLLIGNDRLVFAPVYGPPYVQDVERGRRALLAAQLFPPPGLCRADRRRPVLDRRAGRSLELEAASFCPAGHVDRPGHGPLPAHL